MEEIKSSVLTSLDTIREKPLKEISVGRVGKVVRRVVDKNEEADPKPILTAFNSSI